LHSVKKTDWLRHHLRAWSYDMRVAESNQMRRIFRTKRELIKQDGNVSFGFGTVQVDLERGTTRETGRVEETCVGKSLTAELEVVP